MSSAAESPSEAPPRKKKPLLLIAATLLLAGGGFGSTYLGLWSPAEFLSGQGEKAAQHHGPQVVFVDVPPIRINIPGSGGRSLALSAAIETDSAHSADVQHLMPRVVDAFNGFLAGVDPVAYDKRGVLEIIRGELVTRSRYVLGEQPVKDLLITEFLIR